MYRYIEYCAKNGFSDGWCTKLHECDNISISLISDFLMDAISLRSKLFNLKVNHEKSICLDGFNSLVSNDNLGR